MMPAQTADGHETLPAGRGFELLLRRLDADRDAAGERYEQLRIALIRIFRWRRCATPEELADEVLTRLGRKLADGEPVEDLFRYAHGVARLVMFEHFKEEQKRDTALRDLASVAPPDPPDEELMSRLETCLQSLAPHARELLVSYYIGDAGEKIENRKRLAAAHGLSLFSLRVRVHRLRERLERCLGSR